MAVEPILLIILSRLSIIFALKNQGPLTVAGPRLQPTVSLMASPPYGYIMLSKHFYRAMHYA